MKIYIIMCGDYSDPEAPHKAEASYTDENEVGYVYAGMCCEASENDHYYVVETELRGSYEQP